MTYRLYGTPGSLYTAKARSWLIKNGVPFENRAAGEPRFREEIVPKIGRWIIPVLEAPDGELIQDGSAIIARLEADGLARWPTVPATPRHRVIGQVFELFGGEGLLRPAMHYRWNFDETNLPFIGLDFAAGLATPGADPAEGAAVFQFAAQRMRKAMASFGVSEASIPLVERSYVRFLDLFEAHLAGSPYLLGGRPTIGDYGLIAPLYAHLGRDPHPADLMKRKAHRVWRWVERMNAADLDSGEYGYPPPELFPDDGVPDTLKALLRFVAEDYLPEVRAYVGFANAWLAERPDLEPMTSGLARSSERVIGRTAFDWRGESIEVAVMPYRLWLLQKVQDAAADSPVSGRLLAETGLADLLTLTTSRRVERVNQLEVWTAPL
ncbi:MAG TPA: glutathione S-transferase family protein [Caulobacter sp.]|nr:glutathione S-transferase family protein [Caulobacter sp.]